MKTSLVSMTVLLATGSSALRVAPMRGAAPARSVRPTMADHGVKVTADTKKKNPTAADRPGMSDEFVGMKPNDRDTKKNQRRNIMGKKTYMRGKNPFDNSIHADVTQKMSVKFAGELVEKMKEDTFRELKMGEGDRAVTFVLAKEFGFCWGVERSIELAWAAREAYPDKRMHLTNELIHNPGVNELIGDMGVEFLEKDASAVGGKRFDHVGDGDVVILPAFGASLEEMQLLDDKGSCTATTQTPAQPPAFAFHPPCL